MANEENLKPIRKGDLSKEELKRRQSNGGKKSAEARREKKLIRERILERMTENDWDEFIDGIIERSKKSDKAFEIMRDTIGEKPVDQVNIINVDKSLEEMEAFFNQKEDEQD